jgi:hypothetical protein
LLQATENDDDCRVNISLPTLVVGRIRANGGDAAHFASAWRRWATSQHERDRRRAAEKHPQLGQMDLIAEILNKRTWVGIAATLRSDGLRIQTF